MTTKWATKGSSGVPDFSDLFKEESAVLLLRGKNSFGDHIFSYVKVSFPNMKRLYASLTDGMQFNPSDFGEVIAAGKGEPSEEVKSEIASSYPLLEQEPPPYIPVPDIAPIQKKSWDEY